jgi:hypothetical protein
MEIEIIVPEGLHEITLDQYQRFVSLQSDDEMFVAQKAIEIFCNVPLIVVNNMPYKEVARISKRLFSYFDEKHKLQMRLKLQGKDFGFIPNLEDMTFGEYVDLDTTVTDWATMHNAMAVLYRPIVSEAKDLYRIEQYESSHRYSDTMKKIPMSTVFGALVFFWSLGAELSIAMIQSLEETEQSKTTAQEQTSLESGDGTLASMRSLKETLQSLKALLESPSIQQ